MALEACNVYKKFKPHLLMTLVQLLYTFLYFITEASFKHGMNPHVYITYRNVVACVVMLPLAYFLERKVRPKITLLLFAEIFVLSLLGPGLTLNMYFASFKYTSATFVTSVVNAIPSVTFVIAVVLRLEILDLRKPRGMAKLAGTLVSLAGVMTMTLYKGPMVKNWKHPLIHIEGSATIHEQWLKGSVLAAASCIAWSIWYIIQTYALRTFPAQLSLTAWMSFVGGAQSAFFTVLIEQKWAAWTIGFNVDLWAILYGGVVCSGLITFIQLWCTQEKGPVFVTMFNPLLTILVAVLTYFVLGEKLCIGRILGGAVVITGMYLLLWGKEGDRATQTGPEELTYKTSEEPNSRKLCGLNSDLTEASKSVP